MEVALKVGLQLQLFLVAHAQCGFLCPLKVEKLRCMLGKAMLNSFVSSASETHPQTPANASTQ